MESLRYLEQQFQDYLLGDSSGICPQILTTPEMSAFEWAIQHVLDAANAEIITVAEMALILPEKWPPMRLKFHPALRRLNFQWNTVSIWKAVTDEMDIPQPEESDLSIPWVIWR